MIAAILGIAGLVLALFSVGGILEENMAKAGKFGAGVVICLGLILITSGPHAGGGSQNCHTDWDGRANSEVCD